MSQTETQLNPTQFVDKNGHTWETALTYLEAERIDKSDFTEIWPRPFCFSMGPTSGDRDELENFLSALETGRMVVAMIWVVVLPQVKDQLGIDPDENNESYRRAELEFLKGFDGAAVERAKEAFTAACSDFFRDQKTLLEAMRKRMRESRKKISQKLETQFQKLDGKLDQIIDREMDKMTAELLGET